MEAKRAGFMDPFEVLSLWWQTLMGSEKAYKRLVRGIFEGHAHLVGNWAYDAMPHVFGDDTPAKKFSEIRVGDTEVMKVEVHPHHLLYFARASGDFGDPHFNKKYASKTRFKKPIAHGLLIGSLVSPILAHRLPGKGTIYKSQNFNFKAPVYIGDVITVKVTVTALDPESKRITLSNIITNQDDVVVIEGESVAYPAEKMQ